MFGFRVDLVSIFIGTCMQMVIICALITKKNNKNSFVEIKVRKIDWLQIMVV